MLQNRFLALALLGSVLACKANTPAPAAVLTDDCFSDPECKGGFKCDREQRRCVCTGDAACPGQFCNAFTGQCVASVGGCTSDTGCGAGNYCDAALRTCKPVAAFCTSCSSDAQCGAGSRCAPHPDYPGAGTFCVPACTAPSGGSVAGCANGLVCIASRSSGQLCFPATGACGQSNACVPDSLQPCPNGTDVECAGASQACDATLKECVLRKRTCPAGDACDPQSKLCVHACGSDADCAQIEASAGFQCRANACFRRALCNGDGDCNNTQICSVNPDGSKSCQKGCVTANDCPLGQGCTTNDPNHPRCSTGCTQDADCPINTICASGSCTSTASSCAQTCQNTAACPIGATCTNRCCVELNLATSCEPGGNTGSICSVCTAAGCSQSCSQNCFILTLGVCGSNNDCLAQGYPSDVICTDQKHCQVLAHLQPCSSSADCSAKGFRCVSKATSLGCGADPDSVCVPYEQSAQVACALGHP